MHSKLSRRLRSLPSWWKLRIKLDYGFGDTVTHDRRDRVNLGISRRRDGKHCSSADHHCQRTHPLGWTGMQSLFRSVGRPATLSHRRSLFSAFSPIYFARAGSKYDTCARWPTSVNPSPLSANSRRACSSIPHMSSSISHPEYRLPPDVKPTHYDLTVRTNLENQTFDGFVDVQCVTDLV